jgi:hypothetical protein
MQYPPQQYPSQSGGYPQQSGGYSQGYYPNWLQQSVPGYTDQVGQWFQAADVNRNGRINAQELQRALSISGQEYSMGTVFAMIEMFDMDRSGDIDLNEFVGLWHFLGQMKGAFQQFSQMNGIPYSQVPQALSVNRSIGGSMGSMGGMLQSMYPLFDSSGSGSLNMNQFLKMALNVGRMMTGSERMGTGMAPMGMGSMGMTGGDPMMQYGQYLLGALSGKKMKKGKKDKKMKH